MRMIFCYSGNFSTVKAVQLEDNNYTQYTNDHNETIYTINISDEQLQQAQIEELREKYEGPFNLLNNEYSYTYTPLNSYTTGNNATDYILIGTRLSWAQRSSVTISATASFTVSATYQDITGSSTVSMGINDTISFDSNYDSKLGLFGRIKLTQYRITITDNYSGSQVGSYTDYDLTILSKAYRPVYAENGGKLFFKYGGTRYYAKMLKRSLDSPTLTSSDYEIAYRSEF